MIRAVLDVNVLISALFWRGAPFEVVDALFERRYVGALSLSILRELTEKLRTKFKLPQENIDQLIMLLLLRCVIVDPPHTVTAVTDEADNRILECALASHCKYVVTGDRHLLQLKEYEIVRIVTPREFLRIIGSR